MKRAIAALLGYVQELRRPSRATNEHRMRERGETRESLIIREATLADVSALAQVHVDTFNEAHTLFGDGPKYALREWQWREKLTKRPAGIFVFLAVAPADKVVGFASGERGEGPEFGGHLEKVYVLREYHHLGLGRRLFGHVTRRFLSQGITSMDLFSQAENPSIGFFEALGGERMVTDKGEFHGGYCWRDLKKLAEACPV